jgi:uncharacterized protein YndB with AHSA1/START domain
MTASEPTTRDGVVELETRIEAPRDVVYRYLTEPELVERWNCQTAELEPRPGGIYRLVMTPRYIARGEFVEATPPERIAFTFGWETEGEHPVPPGSSLVEIDLVADGAATLVRLRHSGLPGDAVGDHRSGWEHYHARLAIAATGGDPGPDPNAAGGGRFAPAILGP